MPKRYQSFCSPRPRLHSGELGSSLYSRVKCKILSSFCPSYPEIDLQRSSITTSDIQKADGSDTETYGRKSKRFTLFSSKPNSQYTVDPREDGGFEEPQLSPVGSFLTSESGDTEDPLTLFLHRMSFLLTSASSSSAQNSGQLSQNQEKSKLQSAAWPVELEEMLRNTQSSDCGTRRSRPLAKLLKTVYEQMINARTQFESEEDFFKVLVKIRQLYHAVDGDSRPRLMHSGMPVKGSFLIREEIPEADEEECSEGFSLVTQTDHVSSSNDHDFQPSAACAGKSLSQHSHALTEDELDRHSRHSQEEILYIKYVPVRRANLISIYGKKADGVTSSPDRTREPNPQQKPQIDSAVHLNSPYSSIGDLSCFSSQSALPLSRDTSSESGSDLAENCRLGFDSFDWDDITQAGLAIGKEFDEHQLHLPATTFCLEGLPSDDSVHLSKTLSTNSAKPENSNRINQGGARSRFGKRAGKGASRVAGRWKQSKDKIRP
ncbi:hypothetical protein NliqN6_1224 [Naganishia liquefaciens]|uniref:Uncharacterized protein n=1 Tax=Naganishia liquefaciens TaxID=104408 RepID=A0A8H3YE20_9TREE|nr:hypothetical protein NliqN6_1224 [Naganishia liquefaciens]